MALPPDFAGQELNVAQPPQHTLELYVDYVCPFSAKFFDTFYSSVRPLIARKYQGKVRVIIRQHIQPWHPSSTLVHEAGAAILKLAPEKFWEFSASLFKQQTDFFDANVVNESRNQTYARLAKVAQSVGVDEKQFLDLVTVSEQPGPDGSLNAGNKVTDDVRRMVKMNRVVGVHFTPTVFFDGTEERSISSSWEPTQWEEWLKDNLI